jgi:hypothetical protein
MADPPQDYNICPCCGTEFANDDQDKTHAQLRVEWIAGGMKWFFGLPPFMWNPQMQLAKRVPFWQEFPFYSAMGTTKVYFAGNSSTPCIRVFSYGEPGIVTLEAAAVPERRQRKLMTQPEVSAALAS